MGGECVTACVTANPETRVRIWSGPHWGRRCFEQEGAGGRMCLKGNAARSEWIDGLLVCLDQIRWPLMFRAVGPWLHAANTLRRHRAKFDWQLLLLVRQGARLGGGDWPVFARLSRPGVLG